MMFSISVPDVAFQGLDPTRRRLVAAQCIQAVASDALARAVAGEPLTSGGPTLDGFRVRWWQHSRENVEGCEGVAV